MTTKKTSSADGRSWDDSSRSEREAFGTWLRGQREIREIGLPEIAENTKISSRYLTALEAGDFEALPGPIFVRGFLRQYAGYVGLDPDEAVNEFLIAQQVDLEAAEPEDAASGKRSLKLGSGLLLVLAVVLVLVLVLALSYYSERSSGAEDGSATLPPMAAPPPVHEVPAEPEVVARTEPMDALRVTIDFTDECWVEAVIDEDRQLSEVRVQGESLQIEAAEKVVLTLGDAAAARIEVNGTPFPLTPDPETGGVAGVEILRSAIVEPEPTILETDVPEALEADETQSGVAPGEAG